MVGAVGLGAAGYSWLQDDGSEPEAVAEDRATVRSSEVRVLELEARTDDVQFSVDVESGAVEAWISEPTEGGGYTGVEPIGGGYVAAEGGESDAVRYDLPQRDVRIVFKSESDGDSVLTYRLEWY